MKNPFPYHYFFLINYQCFTLISAISLLSLPFYFISLLLFSVESTLEKKKKKQKQVMGLEYLLIIEPKAGNGFRKPPDYWAN